MKAVSLNTINKMTIKEYFSKEQPINNEVINEIFYKNTQTIIFRESDKRYAQIEIAHIDTNTWAFGWEISDGANNRILKRDCTIRITTKGPIDKLVYGMTKVLQRQLNSLTFPTHSIAKLIDDAIDEASAYCKCEHADTGKITI